jgi:hypothetical protein
VSEGHEHPLVHMDCLSCVCEMIMKCLWTKKTCYFIKVRSLDFYTSLLSPCTELRNMP